MLSCRLVLYSSKMEKQRDYPITSIVQFQTYAKVSKPIATLKCIFSGARAVTIAAGVLADPHSSFALCGNSDDTNPGAAKQLQIKISFDSDDQLSLVAKDAKNCSGILELLQSYTAANDQTRRLAAGGSEVDGW